MSVRRKKYPTEWVLPGPMQLSPCDVWMTTTNRGAEPVIGFYVTGTEQRDLSKDRGELRERHEVGVILYPWDVTSDQRTLMEIVAGAMRPLRMVAEARWREQLAAEKAKRVTEEPRS